ncbi:MAG: FecCD family ABC transporter permease [Bacilli bacterium]
MHKQNQQTKKVLSLILILTTLLCFNAMYRAISIDLTKIFSADSQHTVTNTVFWQLRLPRTLSAMFVGVALALAGFLIQRITNNPLADPGIIGTTSGASLGTIIWIYSATTFGLSSVDFLIPIVAFLGAALFSTLVLALSGANKMKNTNKLLLTGVALQLLSTAIIMILQLRMDPKSFQKAAIWLSGTLYATDWRDTLLVAILLCFVLPFLFYKGRILDVLNIGEHGATSLGVDVRTEKYILLFTSALLSGVCVAIGGGISFIGLIAPHISKRIFPSSYRTQILGTSLCGAVLLLLADTIARHLFSPVELSVGIIIAIIGAPYFLYLLIQTK